MEPVLCLLPSASEAPHDASTAVASHMLRTVHCRLVLQARQHTWRAKLTQALGPQLCPASRNPSEGRLCTSTTMRSVLRWRQQQFGNATAEFLRSEERFESFAPQYKDPDAGPIAFSFLDVRAFSWVVLCVSFFELLQQQHESGLLSAFCITADFTFNLELMGYSCGIIAMIIMRRLAGQWRRSCWPLVIVCGKSECRAQYDRAFEALRHELLRRKIRFPDQVNTDYFSGSREACAAIFAGTKQVTDVWHQRKNLIENNRPKAKAEAKAKAKPKARPRKAKQDPPHLTQRSIGAWLVLLSEFIFLPSRAFFHTVLTAVFNRVQHVWQEPRWLSCYQKQYVSQKPRQDKEQDGASWFWHGAWWSGPGSGLLRGRPASQQPIEALTLDEKCLGFSYILATKSQPTSDGGPESAPLNVSFRFPRTMGFVLPSRGVRAVFIVWRILVVLLTNIFRFYVAFHQPQARGS